MKVIEYSIAVPVSTLRKILCQLITELAVTDLFSKVGVINSIVDWWSVFFNEGGEDGLEWNDIK